MTQPVVVESAPSPKLSAEDILKRIETKLRKLGVAAVKRTLSVTWFPARTALEVMPLLTAATEQDRKELLSSLRPTRIELAKKFPMAPGRHVFALFEDEEEFRAYTLSPNDGAECYKLSKSTPIFSQTGMTLEAFADEIVDEWSQYIDMMSSAEEERSAILTYGEELDEHVSLKSFLQDVRDEVHLETDDEGEEEEETPSTAPPSPPATITPST